MQKIKLETTDEYTKRLGLELIISKKDIIFSKATGKQVSVINIDDIGKSLALRAEMWDKAYKGFSDYEKDLAMRTIPQNTYPPYHPNCRCTWDTEYMEKWGPDYYRTSTGYIIGGE